MKYCVKKSWVFALTLGVLSFGVACSQKVENEQAAFAESGGKSSVVVSERHQKLVDAAHWQIGKTLEYDPAYVGLSYPNGDIPIERGVCTDVVIRAMRRGLQMDLQELVHLDMKRNFSKYPKIWGLKRADKNIDHRRVPNLQVYFKRQGWSLPITDSAADYHPGDLVTCTVGGNRPHIMLVSDYVDGDGVPLVIHNIGGGAELDPHLFTFPLTGHYRVK